MTFIQYFQSIMTRGVFAAAFLGLAAALVSCSYTQVKTTPDEDAPYEETYYEDEQALPPNGFPALDPYGRWVPVGDFGWAWQPDVFRDWRPYYHGHWDYTHWGWTWVSYEPFGWAVYHYGNWVIDPYWGWVWFPDYEWYPNRVSWLVYDDYICWAPLPIHGYGVGDPWMYEYDAAWNISHVDNFQLHYIGDHHVRNFRPTVSRYESRMIYKAPEVGFLETRTGRPVTRVKLETRPVVGGKDGLQKLKIPDDEHVRMREMRTRTHKALYGKREDGETRRTGKGTVTTVPNVITESDAELKRKSKNDSKPTKQEPETKKKEKQTDSKRKGTKPKSSKEKKGKGDDK